MWNGVEKRFEEWEGREEGEQIRVGGRYPSIGRKKT